ncbi:MAG: NAD-dependent epimerase/dehydratase family protein [Bacteroidales bacterium]|nr:NAD-dependent epimerase/dehydratase family protein [Bacteroidales bacterium]
MYLVTGGTGLLGSHLLVELTQTNDFVKAIYRNETKKSITKEVFSYHLPEWKAFYNKIIWLKADVLDKVSLTAAMKDVSHVFHCAAKVSFYPGDKKGAV